MCVGRSSLLWDVYENSLLSFALPIVSLFVLMEDWTVRL